MKNDRFEFEQQIFGCWNVVEDIKVLTKQMMDSSSGMTEDQITNFLIGMETIYNIKFQQLMESFEQLIKNKQL